jgi:hypothetical protein
MSNQQRYWAYIIIIGILYVAVKVVFVAFGYLHPGAIWHGLVPAVLTTAAGLVVMRNRAAAPKPFWHWVLIILPVLVLIATPPFMYWKQRSEWLTEGRLPVLVIYEGFALIQAAIALGLRKENP